MAIARAHILLVEDEQALQMTIGDRLRKENYHVECTLDGETACDKSIGCPFDLIILDVLLPKGDGFEVCRVLRQRRISTPILFLTALGQPSQKIKGLRIGGDDYVTKPFEMQELLARVEALLRRSRLKSDVEQKYHLGELAIDLRGTEVTRNGCPVYLSAREFQLLRYLVQNAGSICSRDEILKEVWGYATDTLTRTVDVHVAALRQKIEQNTDDPKFIRTISGRGYIFSWNRFSK